MTIVVPVYNEAPSLRSALQQLLKTELPIATEIVVVDDGSTDGSLDTIDDLEAEGLLRTIKHGRNLGKGRAVRTAIRDAQGDLLTILDADLEYNPADYVLLLDPILNGETSVVYGTRSFGSFSAYSFWYVIGNRVLTLFASFLFNTWLSDIETCFKMAETKDWRSLELSSDGFGIEAEATAKFLKNGHRIFEVPITYKARSREEGKKLRWTDGVEAFWILVLVRLLGRRTVWRRRGAA